MKILLLTSVFQADHRGGTEVAAYHIAKGLANRGNDVHIIASGYRNLPKEEVQDGIRIRRVFYPAIPVIGIAWWYIKIPFVIRKIRPDVMHCMPTQMAIPAFLYHATNSTPYVVMGQGSDVYLPWKFKNAIHRLVLSHAAYVLALTESMKQAISNFKFQISNLVVVPMGIDLNKIKGDANLRMTSESTNKKIILFAGDLKSVKGPEYLLEAFKKISGAKLIMVGDGPEKETLKSMAQGNVEFVGSVTNEAVLQYMAKADIFCMPSLSEGMPIALLEALASGLPVVASRAGGIPDVIEDGKHGFLVPPKNVNQLAQGLQQLIDDDALRQTMSQYNKEAAKKYSWDVIVEQLISIYAGIRS